MRFTNKVRDWKAGNYMREGGFIPYPDELAKFNKLIMEHINTSEPSLCVVEVTIDVRCIHQFPIGIKAADTPEKEPQ